MSKEKQKTKAEIMAEARKTGVKFNSPENKEKIDRELSGKKTKK